MEDEGLAEWKLWLRRLALVVSTWLMAHVFRLLCDISNVIEGASRAQRDLEGVSSMPSTESTDRFPTRRAGFSCRKVEPGATDEHSWAPLAAETFRVRCGPNYAKNGNKEPSGPALGQVEAVDLLRTERKIFDFLSLNHIVMPEPTPAWSESYPEFLVINQMVPVHFNSSFFTSVKTTDGETFNVIVYVRLRAGLGTGWMADKEPQNAEQLLKRWPGSRAHTFQQPPVPHRVHDADHCLISRCAASCCGRTRIPRLLTA